MRKLFITPLAAISLALALPAAAYAHVTVKPAQVAPGSFTTFTVSVPNEKEVDVTGVKLLLDDELKSVKPTVQPGWTITTEKSGDKVASISWQGSTIPAGQRGDFSFSAQIPATERDLIWKAYQTYADGTTVAWDKEPSDNDSEGNNSGPYSMTTISEETSDGSAATSTPDDADDTNDSDLLPLGVSLLALAFSVAALLRSRRSPSTAVPKQD